MNKTITIIVILIICLGCKPSNKTSNSYSNESYYEGEYIAYGDGTYCAEIEYYNPKTSAHSSYTLPIEVEDEELIKINFSNGGWLDESHFIAPDISYGIASFVDDKGREFEVEILKSSDS
jgi:hypothetical protein